MKYVSFPLNLPIKEEYSDCGSDNNFSCLIHSPSSNSVSSSLNVSIPIASPRRRIDVIF